MSEPINPEPDVVNLPQAPRKTSEAMVLLRSLKLHTESIAAEVALRDRIIRHAHKSGVRKKDLAAIARLPKATVREIIAAE